MTTRLVRSLVATLDRGGVIDAARSERFVGRLAIAGLVVGSLLALFQLLLPGDHVDALWITMIAAILVTAVLVGFLASVITTFLAAVAIDVWLLEPRGSLLVSSRQDVAALGLFLIVALVGGAVASRSRGSGPVIGIQHASAAVAPEPLVEPLTDRELEILVLLSRGLSNREIARECVVSQNTVKTHLEHLYGKLDVPSRGRAVAEARKRALFPTPDDRITPSGRQRSPFRLTPSRRP